MINVKIKKFKIKDPKKISLIYKIFVILGDFSIIAGGIAIGIIAFILYTVIFNPHGFEDFFDNIIETINNIKF